LPARESCKDFSETMLPAHAWCFSSMAWGIYAKSFSWMGISVLRNSVAVGPPYDAYYLASMAITARTNLNSSHDLLLLYAPGRQEWSKNLDHFYI
jgi:hypothetical protein